MMITVTLTQSELEKIVLADVKKKHPHLPKDASVRFEVSQGQRDEQIVSAKVESYAEGEGE